LHQTINHARYLNASSSRTSFFGFPFLKDIVIGMSDGLTVPFALAAGLSSVVDNTSLIVIAGLAEIAAGSIAMGLGGYLAGQTEMDHYKAELRREYDEVERLPEREKERSERIFRKPGPE
jgi:VIT1/CCC1 family predicted Fe2+/Mn2+ transporter